MKKKRLLPLLLSLLLAMPAVSVSAEDTMETITQLPANASVNTRTTSGTFKVAGAIETDSEGANALKNGIVGPQIQISITDIDTKIGANDTYDVTLNFDNIELKQHITTITDSPLIKVIRNTSKGTSLVIGTGDILEAEAEDTKLNLVIKEEGNDFTAGDMIVIAMDDSFTLTKSAEGIVGSVAVSGDFGESEKMPLVSVLPRALDVNMKGRIVSVPETETVDLKKITVESVVGNFRVTDEIKFKLSSGFAFTKYPAGAFDVTATSFRYYGNASDALIFAANEIGIQATTATTGDIASLTVSCNDYTSASADVAIVGSNSSVDVEDAVSSTTNTAAFKVIDPIEINTADAEALKNGVAGPQIQITLKDITTVISSDDSYDVRLRFDNLEVRNDYNDVIDDTNVKVLRNTSSGYIVLPSVNVLSAEKEDPYIDLVIRENGVHFIKGDMIVIALDGVTALTETTEGTTASVTVSGDFGKSDAMTMVSVVPKALDVHMDGKIVSVPEEEIVALKKITIESAAGNFGSTDEITVSLSDGFEFVKCPAGAFDIEDESFKVTGYTGDTITFAADDIKIEAVTAKTGEIATLSVSCDSYGSASVEVAVVGDGSGAGDTSGNLPSGSSSSSFKIVDAIQISEAEAKNLSSIAGPQLQIRMTEVSSVIGQDDAYEIRLNFENIELGNALNDIPDCPQIKVLRNSGSNYIEIGTADVLAAEAEDTHLDLVIREDGVDFATGDIILFSFDNTFVLTRTTEGTIATVTVSGDLGESDALPVVSVLGKTLNITAAGNPVTIAPEGNASLNAVIIESVVGNFAASDEIIIRLNDGFEFTKYPANAYDTTADSFAVTGCTGDSMEFAAGEMEIKATTAAVDDIATLAVSCAGYDGSSTEVAIVNDGISDIEINGTFKVVGDIEVTEEEAKFLTNGIAGPQIQIKMIDVDSALGKNDKFDVALHFDHLELINAITDTSETPVIKVIRYASGNSPIEIPAHSIFAAEAEDTTLRLEIVEDGVEFRDGDIIIIALDNSFGLTKTAEGTIATVTVSGDFGESDALPVVSVLPKAMEINMAGRIVHTAQEEIVALKKISIESTVGLFVATDEIKITLTDGFEFTKLPAGAFDVTSNSFTVTGYTTDLIEIAACDIELEPVTAKPGDIATLTVSCEGYEGSSAEVAEVISTAVIMSVDEDEKLRTFYNGVNAWDEGLTSDDDHKALTVTIKETTPDAWDTVDAWNLSLPEGVYVSDMTVSSNGRTSWIAGSILDTFKDAYVRGNYQSFAFPRRSFEVQDDRTAEINLTLTLVAEPTFSGDVVLTLTGEGISEAAQEVVIAKFKPSYTVETTQTNTTITGEPVSTADITITEAEPGLWRKNSGFRFHFADTDLSFAEGSTMQLQGTNPDGAVSPLTDGLGFTVTNKSDETAAKVVLTGLKAEAAHYEEGKHDLLLTTDMMEAFLQTDLFSTQADVTIGSILGNDTSVTVKEEYLSMEDISFTTEYYLESETGDDSYVLDHTEKVACPAGISVLIPEKTYEHFTENTSKGVHSGTVKADASLVLSRYYDRVDYTITYHTNGGAEISALTAKYGTPITLAEPTRYGYVFDGWYSDEALTAPFDDTTMPANGGEAYAKWISVSENRGTEYTIDSIQLTDGSGNYITTSIPKEVIYAEVSVTNTGSKFKDTTILAAYSGNQLVSLHYMTATTRVGDTVTFGATIDNTDGKITTLKSFVVPLLNGVPLAKSATFGESL